MAHVILSGEAALQRSELPPTVRARVDRVIVRLANWPDVSGVKPLRWALAGSYRVRSGDYRVQFRVVGRSVLVERIGHRDGFYET